MASHQGTSSPAFQTDHEQTGNYSRHEADAQEPSRGAPTKDHKACDVQLIRICYRRTCFPQGLHIYCTTLMELHNSYGIDSRDLPAVGCRYSSSREDFHLPTWDKWPSATRNHRPSHYGGRWTARYQRTRALSVTY